MTYNILGSRKPAFNFFVKTLNYISSWGGKKKAATATQCKKIFTMFHFHGCDLWSQNHIVLQIGNVRILIPQELEMMK